MCPPDEGFVDVDAQIRIHDADIVPVTTSEEICLGLKGVRYTLDSALLR